MPPTLDHNVGDWIARWAEVQPHALAWADDHQRCDYATAADRVARLAGWLDAQGVGPGDRIALWLSNRAAVVEAIFAAARVGAIALPVNARLTAAEVAFQFDDCRPRLVLIEEAWTQRADYAIDLAKHSPATLLPVGGSPDRYERAIEQAAPHPGRPEASPEDPIILMYTSGTTGKPKGALLSLRKALYNGLNAERYFEITPRDRVLIVAPLFHSLGLQILALPAVAAGAGLVIQEGFEPTRVWETLTREGITYYGGVPTMHERLLEALERGGPASGPPASLRFAFTAGAAAPAELIRAYHERGLSMKQGYGQTETSTLTCQGAEQTLSKAGSVGRPVEHATIRLVDPSTIDGSVEEWRDVPAGEVGEIVVAGPINMLGYWERPEANRETLRGEWLRTGDLATRDDEFDITLVGRAREMYISGGENVYPAEVEATLVEHPDIAEAAVVAVPDAQWGETGRAHVVAAAAGAIDSDAILAWLSDRLARYKQPRSLVVESALPRTASGKVQKHRLRDR